MVIKSNLRALKSPKVVVSLSSHFSSAYSHIFFHVSHFMCFLCFSASFFKPVVFVFFYVCFAFKYHTPHLFQKCFVWANLCKNFLLFYFLLQIWWESHQKIFFSWIMKNRMIFSLRNKVDKIMTTHVHFLAVYAKKFFMECHFPSMIYVYVFLLLLKISFTDPFVCFIWNWYPNHFLSCWHYNLCGMKYIYTMYLR